LDEHAIETYKITDRSGHSLGGIYRIHKLNSKGTLVLLPPPTEISSEKAIDKILEALGKHILKEIAPQWICKVPFHPIDQITNEINNLDLEREKLKKKVISKKHEIELLKNHFRLLYETGRELEDAVCEAFKLLGFNEIKKIREKDKEDWVFDFKSLTNQTYGIIEVKGVENQISKQDIQQCEGWVTDYVNTYKNAKGILVANQFRFSPYIESRNARLSVEYNLNDYAIKRNICIVPSCLLFDTVDSLAKGRSIPRDEIEKTLTSKGVLDKL
jgi:hypothetical protein